MGTLKAILRELVALFVDDGSLAASAVILAALCGWGAPLVGVGPRGQGVALALGLAAILAENTLRAAARRNRR